MKKILTTMGIMLLATGVAQAYVAIVNKADHVQIHVVPAPGKVAIDGKLDDWDLSGANLMFLDAASKESYSVRGAMMYDPEYLYVGAQVKDPTPMVNSYSFGGQANMAWNADAIQIFLVADPAIDSQASTMTGSRMPPEQQAFVNMATLWYSTQDGKAGYYTTYTLRYADGTLNPPGVEGVYVRDPDGKGYTMEYRIPWAVLRVPRPLTGGDRIQMAWLMNWGNDQGTSVRCGVADIRNPTSGDLLYMGPAGWGKAVFEKTGDLKLERPSALGRAEGHIPIPFKLAKPGKVSLALCDAQDRLVRTGCGAQPYPAGEHTWLWDGLDDHDQPVPPGTYTAKLLTHDGIGQRFVANIGVNGTPPYQTEDGTGGWAGDYRHPQTVGILGDTVILGTASAEAAPATIRADLEGRKRYGTAVIGHAVALHDGFGYMLSAGGAKITKFNLDTGFFAPFATGSPETYATTRREGEDNSQWNARSWQVLALTVADGRIVVSSLLDDKLFLLDLASGEARGEAPIEKPAGLAAAPDGTLYAVSGNAVGRYDLAAGTFTAILGGLDKPRHLACDAAGNLYVSLQGKTMQVWRLSPQGKVLHKYGTPGGRPELGAFDRDGMLNPYGIAVDRNGRLWVAEADAQPKRYSVWNPDGTLWKDFFGSMDYSTTAYVDPAHPEFVYAQSVRYRVDYATGAWVPDTTILRPRVEEGVPLNDPASHAGAVFVNLKNRKFLVVGNGLNIYEEVNGQLVPRLATYTAESEVTPVDKNGKPGKPRKTRTPSLWVDDDNDGHVQPAEIRAVGKVWRYYWSPVVDGNLNLYGFTGVSWASQGGTKTDKPYSITRWDFLGFNPRGGLTYGDPAEPTVMATDAAGGAVAAPAVSGDGSLYALVSGGSLERGARAQGSGHRVVKFSPRGEKLWEYRNVHCAFAWTSETYAPGDVVSAIGFVRGTTEELVGVTGYYGQYFLLDPQTGLFVDALGQDQRTAYTLDHTMVLTENFNGTLFKLPDGKTYFLGGDADCRLWELTGLETIQRQTAGVKVTPAMVVRAAENARRNLLAQQSANGRKTLTLVRLRKAAADGNDAKWGKVQPRIIAMVGKRTAQAQVGYDDANLYVRFQIGDESPFVNTPTDQRLLFKTGDSVEINLATDLEKRPARGEFKEEMRLGDMRLIIARSAEGKLLATRYRYVTLGKEKPNAFSVETQSSGKDTLDDVVPWNELPMHVTVDKDGYTVEVAVPWKELGIEPRSGLTIRGDLGVIYGNEGGTRNAIHYMWADKSPQVSINNDIPSEIRIRPNAWGTWVLE